MLKRLLLLDGVEAVCQFRDDGMLVEGYGLDDENMTRFAKFAHDFKRMVQGNSDQLSMFTGMRGWTPPGGWLVRGPGMTACSVGNVVCILDNAQVGLNGVMEQMKELGHW